ncbi:MAG: cell division protein ZipA [Porticoccaceae bacterium]|nr:cell division protein ZipA [Porticoccaceae bacterium]
MVFLAIVLDFLRRKKRNRYENLQMSSREISRASRYEYEEDPFSDSQFPSGGSRVVGTRDDDYSEPVENEKQNSLFHQPEQAKFDWDDEPAEQEPTPISIKAVPKKQAEKIEQAERQELLVIHLMTAKDQTCDGQKLLDTAVSLGLRYGNMKIFHRHTSEVGSGPVLFSMANLLNPGTFDLTTIGQQKMVGVTLFMAPSDLDKPGEIFDLMMNVAEQMAEKLQLNIMDESRSSMTKQTIDHYRHRAQQAVLLQERSG